MRFLLLLPILCFGCTGVVHKVGMIGEYDVYSVKLPSAAGPSINVAILQKGSNEPPQVIAVGTGNGLGPTALQMGGLISAAAVLKPTHVENSSTIVDGTTSATKPDMIGPPPPPGYVPPYKWGPTKP